MMYINTLADALRVEDGVLCEAVKNDIHILLDSYHIESLENGKCTYGGCVVIISLREMPYISTQFKGMDITLPEIVDIIKCEDGSVCIHLLYILMADYSISIYIKN